MELKEFIEKFCPDYKQKDKKWNELIEESINCYAAEQEADALFNEMFTNALENFKKQICEIQREECMYAARINEYGEIEGCYILEANEPDINEIMNS